MREPWRWWETNWAALILRTIKTGVTVLGWTVISINLNFFFTQEANKILIIWCHLLVASNGCAYHLKTMHHFQALMILCSLENSVYLLPISHPVKKAELTYNMIHDDQKPLLLNESNVTEYCLVQVSMHHSLPLWNFKVLTTVSIYCPSVTLWIRQSWPLTSFMVTREYWW